MPAIGAIGQGPALTPIFQLRGAGSRGQLEGGGGPQSDQGTAPPGTPANERNLTDADRQTIRELKQRDTEVRQHEQAHKNVGGPYASPPSYEYATGPDGRRYAVGGEVKIDVSPVRGNPEATIRKMEVVKRAALAPAEPSPQDRAVASQADAIKAQAQSELRKQRQLEREAGGPAGTGEGAGAGNGSGSQQASESTRDRQARQEAQAAYQRAANIVVPPPQLILFA